MRYVRALLGGRCFLHAGAEQSHEAVWEDVHRRSVVPDAAHMTFTFQTQFVHAQVAALG